MSEFYQKHFMKFFFGGIALLASYVGYKERHSLFDYYKPHGQHDNEEWQKIEKRLSMIEFFTEKKRNLDSPYFHFLLYDENRFAHRDSMGNTNMYNIDLTGDTLIRILNSSKFRRGKYSMASDTTPSALKDTVRLWADSANDLRIREKNIQKETRPYRSMFTNIIDVIREHRDDFHCNHGSIELWDAHVLSKHQFEPRCRCLD